VERFHDVRLVWSSQVQDSTTLCGGDVQLDDCLCRVLVRCSCQSYWSSGLLGSRVEDDAGSNNACSLRGFLSLLPEGSYYVEPCRGVCTHRGRRRRHLPRVSLLWKWRICRCFVRNCS